MSHRVTRDDGGFVRGRGPAVVVALPVQAGDEVAAGDVVAVVETMKMELSLTAPFAGRVRQVLVAPNVQVGAHAPLLPLDPLDGAAEPAQGERVMFRSVERVRRGPAAPRVADARLRGARRGGRRNADGGARIGEHRLLRLYADVRASPDRAATPATRRWRAARRSTCTRSCARSTRALSNCRSASSRCSSARSRTTASTASTARPRWRTPVTGCSSPSSASERRAPWCSRSSTASSRRPRQPRNCGTCWTNSRRRPRVATRPWPSARAKVRHAAFDAPLAAAAREAVYAAIDEHLAALADDRQRADRGEHMRALVECPRAMAPILIARMADAGPELRAALLEAMTARFYRVRPLAPFVTARLSDVPFALTHYDPPGLRRHLAAAFVEFGGLDAGLRALAGHAAELLALRRWWPTSTPAHPPA